MYLLSSVLPPVLIDSLRLARKKSYALFLGQIFYLTLKDIMPRIFKCETCNFQNAVINIICHMNKLIYIYRGEWGTLNTFSDFLSFLQKYLC